MKSRVNLGLVGAIILGLIGVAMVVISIVGFFQ